MFKKVNRAWGWYLVLRETPNTKWKVLYFRRGSKLSMQKHFKRNEKWWFVLGHGMMKVHAGDFPTMRGKWREVSAFDSVEIRKERWHQYIAHEPTIVLEKQMGICEEEDIERA